MSTIIMVRFKNRYLVVELYTIDNNNGLQDYMPSSNATTNEAALSTQSMVNLLRSSLSTNFGQHGAALASQSLSVKYCNANTGIVLVRCAREQLSMVWAALTFAGGERKLMKVIHVSGTIKSAQKRLMQLTIGKLEQQERKVTDEKTKKFLKGAKQSCIIAIRSIDA